MMPKVFIFSDEQEPEQRALRPGHLLRLLTAASRLPLLLPMTSHQWSSMHGLAQVDFGVTYGITAMKILLIATKMIQVSTDGQKDALMKVQGMVNTMGKVIHLIGRAWFDVEEELAAIPATSSETEHLVP